MIELRDVRDTIVNQSKGGVNPKYQRCIFSNPCGERKYRAGIWGEPVSEIWFKNVSSAARSFEAKNELCKIFLQILILGSQTEKKRDTTSVIRGTGVNTPGYYWK